MRRLLPAQGGRRCRGAGRPPRRQRGVLGQRRLDHSGAIRAAPRARLVQLRSALAARPWLGPVLRAPAAGPDASLAGALRATMQRGRPCCRATRARPAGRALDLVARGDDCRWARHRTRSRAAARRSPRTGGRPYVPLAPRAAGAAWLPNSRLRSRTGGGAGPRAGALRGGAGRVRDRAALPRRSAGADDRAS